MEKSKINSAKIFLFALKNQELKELCKDYKIKGFSSLNKDELISLLLKAIPRLTFEDFLEKIRKKALNEILSIIPKYFLPNNPTILNSLNYDENNQLLELNFKGFSWNITTILRFLNLFEKSEPLGFNSKCTCEYYKKGGICSHIWTGVIWIFQKFSINPIRWKGHKLPELASELINSLDFTKFEVSRKGKKDILEDIEGYLKSNLMGKTVFKYEDLEDLSISNITNFLNDIDLKLPTDLQKKHKKAEMINFIKNNLREYEFNKRFFKFKKESRILEAKRLPIEITELQWGPPLNCKALITEMKEKEENLIEISIKNNSIKHDDCHWVYHRSNFCSHLISLFLNLASKDEQKTLDFLKQYNKRFT